MLNNITKRLAVLLKARGKNKKKASKGSQMESENESSYQDINKQLQHIEKTIRELEI